MKLVLVESPTKARKLSGYLDRGYTVRASVGHIRDLPKSKMGVDVENGFTPEYLIPKDKAKVVKELQQLAKDADTIILATDPDREGEAIGWHLQELLKTKVSATTKFVRSTFHEITEKAVLAAINNPIELNMALVDAQQARRILDRLVGYTVSPVLWKKIRYGLSAGRVQSVALRLIVDREREIEAFKPDEYWELDVLLNTNISKNTDQTDAWKSGKAEDLPEGMLVGRAIEIDGKAYEPKQVQDVAPLVAALPQSHFVISQVEKKERRRSAVPPFTTSTLQQNAATRLGYTSKNTMRLAQNLYEEGLITYHRTDSLNISTQAMDAARSYITKSFGNQYIPDKPNFYSTKSKNAQEAHEAVRPTSPDATPEKVRAMIGAKLTEQHVKVYDLIWRRFLASQMAPAVYDQTTVLIACSVNSSAVFASTEKPLPQKMTFKSNGSVLKFDGWMKLFPNQGDVLLPAVSADQPLLYSDHHDAQKFTQSPPRFNDASLIKTLESEGIGRPSTYASIISVIEDRGYVERREKRFYPTPIGMAVTDFLKQHFDTIVDYKFTANMEDDLDAISRGEKEWQKIVGSFYEPLNKKVSSVVETAERAQIPVEKTGVPCPKCGDTEQGEVVIRAGKFGKFKSCSRFPACDFTENIVNKVDGVICPLCQEGDVVIKPTRYGRDFYSCTRYPECNWASWKKPAPGEKITAEEWKVMQAEREAKRKEREASGKTNPRFAKKTSKADSKKAPAKTAKKTSKIKSTVKKPTTKKKAAATKKA